MQRAEHQSRQSNHRLGPENKCHKCNKLGHRQADCDLREDEWYCYYCNRVTNHKGNDNCCLNRPRNSRGKKFNQSNKNNPEKKPSKNQKNVNSKYKHKKGGSVRFSQKPQNEEREETPDKGTDGIEFIVNSVL